MDRLQAAAGELIARDGWSRARLVTYQRERLTDLIGHAVASSPYYRRVLPPGAASGRVPLEELPVLSKETLMEEFDHIVTDPRLCLKEVDRHTAGPDPASSLLGHYRVFSTGGSTGVRGVFVYAHDEFAHWTAAVLRTLSRFGVKPGARLVAIGAPSPLHISRQLFGSLQSGRADAPRLSVLTPLPEIVDALNVYRPEVMLGYPTMASLLAEEQMAGRLDIEPRVLVVGSEVLTEDTQRRVRQTWGVSPFNVYASTEVLMLASSCPADVGLHISEDLVVLEVVDEENRPVPAGTPGYKVLVTNLVNRVQPLIRYELCDSITLAEEPNPTGRPYQRISSIDGRSDDIIYVPATGGGEVAVHPHRLRAPFSNLLDVRQYQIVYDDLGLHARIVLRPGAAASTPEEVRAALAQELRAAGALVSGVDVQVVTTIEREGNGAKIKLVKAVGRPVA